jgi:hypothetical protein
MRKLLLGTVVTALVLTGVAAPANATTAMATARPVYRVTDPTFESAVYWNPLPVLGAGSVLTRQAPGVSIWFSTNSLPRGHAVTLWWFVFNHPENCTHGTVLGHCGPHDLAILGGDPSVESSVVYGTGRVADGWGLATFASSLSTGDASLAAFGPGVTNPRGAELHVGLRDDGSATIPPQLGFSICPECPFVQFSAFPVRR